MKTPAARRVPITVTLPPALVDEIDLLAEEQDLPRSRVTARAITEFLERRRAEAGQPDAAP
jgi:predicted transcriptional regulator